MYVKDDQFSSYELIKNELLSLGYTHSKYNVKQRIIVKFSRPDRYNWLTSISRIYYPLVSGFALPLANNKTYAYESMQQINVPVPWTHTLYGGESITDTVMEQYLKNYSRLVVKPQQASLSHGLTMHIQSTKELRAAINYARSYNKYSENILIQQQMLGDEIRFTVLDGEVIGALLRLTPRVLGDAKHTVRQLIEIENGERRKLKNTMVQYPQLDSKILNAKIIDYEFIPPINEVVELGSSTMIKGGASVYEILEDVHPSYIDMIKTSARFTGARFIVADFFIENYKKPYNSSNAYFNEFNIAPILKLFYSCRDGKNLDIVPVLAKSIDRALKI